jgi:asparagine synthase (glutamine-hydrolysing)
LLKERDFVCGIVGWLDFRRDLSREHALLAMMTRTMGDRGPDAEGVWLSRNVALGHRRLAIVDIEGGRQPMLLPSGDDGHQVAVTYSGEIYNYRELRAELLNLGHRFVTRSDTEVLLRAYLAWGTGFLTRLNGMFAFGLWDSRTEELLLCRDRLGVKPLYYHRYGTGVLFASEPKGILAHPGFTARLRLTSLPVLFNGRLGLPGETPLADLYQVRPGHCLRLRRNSVREVPYWHLVSQDHLDDEKTTVGVVRDLLEDIVTRQLDADVPQCTLLSGGLDSSAISAIAARRLGTDRRQLSSFSVEFVDEGQHFRSTPLRPERDAPFASLMAKHIDSDHTHVVIAPEDFPTVHTATMRARDLPSLGQFDQSLYLLFREVQETATVALSGEAADELFGGYPWFLDSAFAHGDTFPWLGDGPRITDCLAPDIRSLIRPDDLERDRYRTLIGEVPGLDGESGIDARMREVLFLSMQGPLTYLLDRQDRMSMAVGLEVRVPFCDHRLVEYLWNVPWKMKIGDGREKSLLRAAVADLLPQQVLYRRKSGYPATFSPGYTRSVIEGTRRILDDATSPLGELLDTDRVRALTEFTGQTMAYASTAQILTPLVEVDAWLREYRVEIMS